MKKIVTLSLFTATLLIAEATLLKTTHGSIRGGYQQDDNANTDMALGGKLHIETRTWRGISAGASFYTTQSIGQNDGAGVPFFDANNNGYSILAEAYLQGVWGHTSVKIGRQKIETPFADTDDIGMIPNTFEAAVLTNKDITDTTLTLAQLQRVSGVDAAQPSKFSKVNGDDGVQTVGITYEGIEDLTLSGWYYNLNDAAIDTMGYLEATFERNINGFSYGLGAQYASQTYTAAGADDATLYGFTASAGLESAGITLSAAYNKSSDSSADNGFGGGPFFTSSEQLTLSEAGRDGEAVLFSAEWDASTAGLSGLSLAVARLTLEAANATESEELDMTASYALNDALTLDLIYSDVDDKINGEKFTNLRVFANYNF